MKAQLVEVGVCSLLTLALNGGRWSVLCPCHFYPWNRAQVPIVQEAEGAQELVWVGVEKRESLALTMV